jgi:tRNA dimethylallyltransferase
VLAAAATVRLLVLPDRDHHGALIDARFDAMLAAGALDEVRALLALGLSGELPVMRALGVAPLARHLAGGLSLDDAAAAAKAGTRRYAKRQLTWLRRNMITWNVVHTKEMERFMRHEFPFIVAGVDPAPPAR